MKHAKKLASLLLALVMVLAMGVTSFAAPESGTIIIKNAVKGQTYTVYQILDLERYSDVNYGSEDNLGNPTGGTYFYKATKEWKSFIEMETINGVYVNVSDEDYVTWIDGASAADFAKAAHKYAVDNELIPGYRQNYDPSNEKFVKVDPVKATGDPVRFDGLDLGYYLVDSTMGTLCSLDTTNPTVTVKEKNVEPTNDKEIKEGDNESKTNDAAIGDTVTFTSTITAQAGAQNYVLHDKMDDGLTFSDGSVKVKLNNQEVSAEVTNADGTKVTNYTLKTTNLGEEESCTFHVEFTQEFCDTLKANDQIVISYSATVNENAVVGNGNSSWLKYGENSDSSTTPSTTKTYTWGVDVFKYAKDGETEKPLANARFTLNKNFGGTNPIALIREKDEQGKDTNTYRVAKTGETDTIAEITTDNTGKFTIKGLDSGTYYLTETYTPAGYNKLAGPIKIVIAGTDAKDADKGTVTYYNYDKDKASHYENESSGTGEIKVLNQSGNELPSTGGMGTTIFYVLGTILLLGSAVLLITRRRMNAEK